MPRVVAVRLGSGYFRFSRVSLPFRLRVGFGSAHGQTQVTPGSDQGHSEGLKNLLHGPMHVHAGKGPGNGIASNALEPQRFPPPAPMPAWARASGRAGEGDPLFAAGAGLALLDACLRRDPRCAGALRSRLALTSTAASAKILRLNVRPPSWCEKSNAIKSIA
jgi:hypothetical protein